MIHSSNFEMRMVRWLEANGLRPEWAAANDGSHDDHESDNDYRPLDTRLLAPRPFKYPTLLQLAEEERQQLAEEDIQRSAASAEAAWRARIRDGCAEAIRRSAAASRLGLV